MNLTYNLYTVNVKNGLKELEEHRFNTEDECNSFLDEIKGRCVHFPTEEEGDEFLRTVTKENIVCKNCGEINNYCLYFVETLVRADCNNCKKYIKFVKYGSNPIFHFGKYAGVKVRDVLDLSYLEWFKSKNKGTNSFKRALNKQIDLLKQRQ